MVNKERKRRARINEEISLKQYREYFMGVLGGMDRKMVRGKKRKEKIEQTEIERKEVYKITIKIKSRKREGWKG